METDIEFTQQLLANFGIRDEIIMNKFKGNTYKILMTIKIKIFAF